ncbi:hypothetical protein HIM_12522 [Hirsutella minnesotensis 3608]|uniref:Uncharacterized protein n=1 Tax=Hirsutella minnesotensis 3608 TaxID=1043627 RepID=A0A0F7ZQL8_9HYPO|nr:hypothetical protein HIM_12522 [Hirsutella minnesotensis 3608]
MKLSSSGLYGYLRSRAGDFGEHPVFDMDRIWSMDAVCIKAKSPCMVAVYFLHDGVEHMDSCWQQLEASLAVDADIYRFTPGDPGRTDCSAAFLFSHLSPLVGSMTYREVQLAVEHYLGWCSKLDRNIPRWKSAERITVELIHPSKRTAWFKSREKAFSDRVDKGFGVGWGFPCIPPCKGEAMDLITDICPEVMDLVTDKLTDVESTLLLPDEQDERKSCASIDDVSSHKGVETTERE